MNTGVRFRSVPGHSARDMWHLMRRSGLGTPDWALPKVRLAPVHHTINARHQFRRILDRTVVNGWFGVVRSGHDCDCSQYYRESIEIAPKGAVQFMRQEQEHEEWLDGPESTHYRKPDEITPQHKSRDRALEAYEDGHPHLVFMGDIDD